MKPKPPKVRIHLEGTGWLCNEKIGEYKCRMAENHKGKCKHTLSLWDIIKRQFAK